MYSTQSSELVRHAGGAVVYSINGADQLRDVNEEWRRFAIANGTDDLGPDHVLGHSLWDYLADSTTVQLYREIVRVVRKSGRPARFPFRCDAPDRVRELQMEISTTDGSTVQFRVTSVRERERAAVSLLSPAVPRNDGLVTMCGWCKRVLVGEGRWAEVEEAVRALALFGEAMPPGISHGICGECHRAMDDEISRIAGDSHQH